MVDEASNAHRSQILAKQNQSHMRRQRFAARRQLERPDRLRRSHRTLQVKRQNRRMSDTFFKT
jgi:hypothetical protein